MSNFRSDLVSSLIHAGKPWQQVYDPAHHWWLSTAWAALPMVVLLVTMIGLRMKAHLAALTTLASAILIAVAVFHMPLKLAGIATGYGAAYGLFPIFWIVFPVMFLYQLTVHAQRFNLLQECLQGVTEDSRLQLLLIAFCFGAFFEGAAGFGTPVAVCATILIGLGFAPVEAAGLALLANTAPVAFGSLGIPVIAMHGVTGLDTLLLTRVVSALLTPFCLLIPFWLIWAYAGLSKMLEVWPALLVAGGTFAATQFLVARFHGPWLVDISAAVLSIMALVYFLKLWKPKRILNAQREDVTYLPRAVGINRAGILMRAGLPWLILTLCVTIWGLPGFNRWLDRLSSPRIHVPGLDGMVLRVAPVAPISTVEPAIFLWNWLSAAGTGIFVAALIAGFCMGLRPRAMVAVLWRTVLLTRFTLITIAALMGFGFVARYCGLDATLGLAFARTGSFYPFFGALIGWIGTASTGSDTSSNVLFGSLQKLTAQQLGLSPYLMTSANSGGGVMGKMVAPQSVVVATTAAGIYGSEGTILRFVFLHSLGFACLMGGLVALVAHSPLLTRLILNSVRE